MPPIVSIAKANKDELFVIPDDGVAGYYKKLSYLKNKESGSSEKIYKLLGHSQS
jgi:hypothetical protein